MKNRTIIGALLVLTLLIGIGASCGGANINVTPANGNAANRPANTGTAPTNASNTSNANRPPAGNSNTAGGAANSNSGSSSSSQQAGAQNFRLRNETGVIIYSLYVGPSASDEWGPDILGRDTLPSGEAVDITFSPNERAALWDLKVTDPQGNSVEWRQLNLLEISEVTLRMRDGQPVAETR